ncbi:hypothetical protein CLF_106836 [Clonorchis sinensis]|uniref:Uncharacterized protein n=1 Tax=Clonorchis sinensis TaxID=79923 RepID=G7YFT7_CLOSI|nr:hypothetical protein CLF_106836 [Clonorchis sinensis]
MNPMSIQLAIPEERQSPSLEPTCQRLKAASCVLTVVTYAAVQVTASSSWYDIRDIALCFLEKTTRKIAENSLTAHDWFRSYRGSSAYTQILENNSEISERAYGNGNVARTNIPVFAQMRSQIRSSFRLQHPLQGTFLTLDHFSV